MNINAFKAVLDIRQGPAEEYLYLCYVSPPGFLEKAKSAVQSMFVESVTIPGKRLMTDPFIMYGTEVKMPYGIMYDPVTITYGCTNSMQERKFFDTWYQNITNPYTNYWNYYNEYVGDVFIAKLPPGVPGAGAAIDAVGDIIGNTIAAGGLGNLFGGGNVAAFQQAVAFLGSAAPLYFIWLQEAYPISLTAGELNAAGTSYLRFSVEFSYRRWLSAGDIATGGGSVPVPPDAEKGPDGHTGDGT